MSLEPLPPLYTSRAEMEEIFSRLGIDSRIDDDQSEAVDSPYDFSRNVIQPNEETYLDAIILSATELFNQYLLSYYDAQLLVDSRWIRSRCTWVACFLLSQRRGNPEQFTEQYNEILATIRQIALGPGINGNPQIPRIPTRFDFRPALSNLVVDDHYSQSKIRVIEKNSTGRQPPDTDADFYFFPE